MREVLSFFILREDMTDGQACGHEPDGDDGGDANDIQGRGPDPIGNAGGAALVVVLGTGFSGFKKTGFVVSLGFGAGPLALAWASTGTFCGIPSEISVSGSSLPSSDGPSPFDKTSVLA